MFEHQGLRYQPFYCEENIWCLAQRADLFVGPTEVVFIVGPDRRDARVACWYQRAAREGEPVLWDYHVVLAERRLNADGSGTVFVWDLDTRLPCPCPAALWVAATFQDSSRVNERYHPRWRVTASDIYVRELATDRSHMRDERGRWRRPPPPWQPPGAPAMNLARWIGMEPGGPAVVLDRAGLAARWCLSP